MESLKRCKNFTEREKMLLIEVAKEFVSIIDNKKTDGTSVEAKKRAWMALTKKYNAVSETGCRTPKQLHALYDNLKKKARKNMSDDKSELYKTGGGIFGPQTTEVDQKVVAVSTPHFKPLTNEYDSSAPYYKLETKMLCEDKQVAPSQDVIVVDMVLDANEGLVSADLAPEVMKCSKTPISPSIEDANSTPKVKKTWNSLTETKERNKNSITSSIIKIKTTKQINEDAIAIKRLEILDIQRQHEVMKLEKTKILMDLDIELKGVLLENAKLDLELKKRSYNL